MREPSLRKNLRSTPSSVSQPLVGTTDPAPAAIDPEELAKEVFKLIKEDLRRERERQGRQARLGKETA
jgi:hypothetical protein